ncbi:MAG: FkbM family methyltransferase, partial [Paludibacter sp.]|nr:FkbM family methyltransferase [Paludibacter sp.]
MITRYIYPLSLRERLFGRMNNFLKNKNLQYENVSLEFNRKLKLDLTLADYCHRNMIINGFWELAQTEKMTAIARQGGLLVDVGANYGYYTCLWAAAAPANKVVAFEASPLNVEPLRHNIVKNGLTDKITVESLAAGKERGKLKFDLRNEEQETGHGGFSLE